MVYMGDYAKVSDIVLIHNITNFTAKWLKFQGFKTKKPAMQATCGYISRP
jgi:hypothetical protein